MRLITLTLLTQNKTPLKMSWEINYLILSTAQIWLRLIFICIGHSRRHYRKNISSNELVNEFVGQWLNQPNEDFLVSSINQASSFLGHDVYVVRWVLYGKVVKVNWVSFSSRWRSIKDIDQICQDLRSILPKT